MYAVIEASSDITSMLYLIRGSSDQIAKRILSECDALIEAFEAHREPDPDLHTDFYSYHKLLKNPSVQNIKAFTFDISDCHTDVVCLVSDFDELAEEFEDFKMGYENLFEWRMIPPEKETDETFDRLNNELILLSQLEGDEFQYFEEVDE